MNEARLSAIAISLYLIFDLDIGNRLPLLEILESQFQDYQIFITTYDKPFR